MKTITNRFLSTFLLIAVLLSLTAVPASATSLKANSQLDEADRDIASEVIIQATSWLENNYEEFYHLRNVNVDIARVFENESEIRYTVAMSCETMPKANSVDELPFVKGLLSAMDDRRASSSEREAIDCYINELNPDFGEYTPLTVDVVISIDKSDTRASWAMYYQDGMETTLYDIEELTLDAQEIYDAGREAASDIATTYINSVSRGYSSYDNSKAVTYAKKWVGSPTDCYDCGTSCGNRQNRTKWNNTEYPYFTVFKHTDCADFVSQAMSAGGLPESGTWFRTKKTTTQDWGAAWTSVSSLKTWMTHKDRKYWDSSTYAKTNAGNILLTSSSHVVMVTYHDGTTTRFSGHTNDRNNYAYSNSSGYEYYTIKT